jgi:hypothetical protein
MTTARPEPGGENGPRLATKAETTDQFTVALDIVVLHVVKEATPTSDELQEPTTGVVITLVDLEVLGEMDDALAQNGDLHLRRTGVRLVESVLGDGGLLV